ncbi:MAG TPA: M15 family metallopeptidase [Aquabacterium sp.]|nr:M15 family metallopeptidase [Aquabacterium sp.]
MALAWLLFPHWRKATKSFVWTCWGRAEGMSARWRNGAAVRQKAWHRKAAQVGTTMQNQLRRHWRWGTGVVLILLLPALLTAWWAMINGRSLDAFDDRIEPGNRQVSQLLMGEHLVPPPPLPPEVFTAADIEQVRPMLSSADRHWDQMDEAFVQRLLLVFKIMREEHGYDMALLEGYRSPERQDMLAARGAHVTQAKAWQSYHQYGLAADCAFVRAGRLVISEKDPWAQRGYALYGQVAEQVGLTWGGRWQMMDLGHVEWRKPGAKLSVR